MDMTTATDISVALVSALGIRKAMKYDVSKGYPDKLSL